MITLVAPQVCQLFTVAPVVVQEVTGLTNGPCQNSAGRTSEGEIEMSNFAGSRTQLINLDQVRKLQCFGDDSVEVTYSNGDIESITKEQQPELYQELLTSIRVKGDQL